MTKILDPKRQYVVGFVFDPSLERVLLIRKKRPDWQAGKLNGIGGGVERGESLHAAMERECMEECGVLIPHRAWQLFFSLQDRCGWRVHFFFAVKDRIGDAKSTTDEDVEIVHIDRLAANKCMTNLRWLIPMALTMKDETCKGFDAREL